MRRFKRIAQFVAVIALIALAWVGVQFTLPFGNHLFAAMWVTEAKRSELRAAEKLFVVRGFSEKLIKLRGYDCDADVVDLTIDYSLGRHDAKDGSVALAILMYEEQRNDLQAQDASRLRSIVFDLIASCDPNVGPEGRPPVVDAIFAEEEEFVQALLNRGANPLYEYGSGAGTTVTPLRAAERLAEIEVVRLQENPDHPQATGKAQRILDLILAHIAENP